MSDSLERVLGARRLVVPANGLEFEVFEAGARLIVVATNDGVHVLAGPRRYRVGVGAVADNVAAAQNPVVAALRVRQHRVKRFEIGVNIADDQVAHKRIRETSGGAPRRTGKPTVPRPLETYPAVRSILYKPRTYGVK